MRPRAVIAFVAGIARSGAEALRQLSRAIAAQCRRLSALATAVGVTMLLGIVGAIALQNSLGLARIVVVVPVCSFALGALAHRWYSGLGVELAPRVESQGASPTELQRVRSNTSTRSSRSRSTHSAPNVSNTR